MTYSRIISLAPSITESLFYLKAGNLLVGRTDYCNFPESAKNIKSIGGFITPDLYKIKAIRPELLIATTTHKKEELEKVKSFGIEVKTLTTENIFDSPTAIIEIGKLIGKEKLAKEKANILKNELDHLLRKAKNIEQRKKVYYMCSTDTFCSWKKKCTTTKLIELAGGKPIRTNTNSSLNRVVSENPDIIIIPYHKSRKEFKVTFDFLNNEKQLHKTKAFKNNQIHSITGELLLRPGPRAAIGFKQLIQAIHPDIFINNNQLFTTNEIR